MFHPGLECTGSSAITLLAALKVGSKILKSKTHKETYNKLFWKYGYGFLSLFPTTFIPSKRGYFNDHNCMVAAYILAKLADRSEEHTSELQSREKLVCRLL